MPYYVHNILIDFGKNSVKPTTVEHKHTKVKFLQKIWRFMGLRDQTLLVVKLY